MAVYTEVTLQEAQNLFAQLGLGEVSDLQGCKGGIENTNYFVDTSQGRYVLTLFERLTHEQLPFYLYLMKHLAQRGIPVPDPQADKSGDILLTVLGNIVLVKRHSMIELLRFVELLSEEGLKEHSIW